jgi:hypothetical protein
MLAALATVVVVCEIKNLMATRPGGVGANKKPGDHPPRWPGREIKNLTKVNCQVHPMCYSCSCTLRMIAHPTSFRFPASVINHGVAKLVFIKTCLSQRLSSGLKVQVSQQAPSCRRLL